MVPVLVWMLRITSHDVSVSQSYWLYWDGRLKSVGSRRILLQEYSTVTSVPKSGGESLRVPTLQALSSGWIRSGVRMEVWASAGWWLWAG